MYSFRKPMLFWISLVLLIAGGVVIKATQFSDKARERYEELVRAQPRKERKSRLKSRQQVTKQTRWDVQKAIWLSEGPVRRVLELDAKRSEMAMLASKKSLHFVETFYNASGIVQQELYYKGPDAKEYLFSKDGTLKERQTGVRLVAPVDMSTLVPMQCFRYFEAKQAVCDFDTEAIIAKDIIFWTYVVEGHEVCRSFHTLSPALSPVAIGKATSMTLAKKNEEREFYAENLRLQIKNEQGVW